MALRVYREIGFVDALRHRELFLRFPDGRGFRLVFLETRSVRRFGVEVTEDRECLPGLMSVATVGVVPQPFDFHFVDKPRENANNVVIQG